MTQSISSTQGTGSTQTTSLTKTASSALGKDEFLKLLTYQLKAQNPLKPYDNQEFASQLAQFSQLEQLSDIRSLLEESATNNTLLTQTMANSALPGMLGKSAKAMTDTVNYNGTDNVQLGFTSPYSVASGKLVITDANGALVNTIELNGKDLSKGDHSITWDGKNLNGDSVTSGDYKFNVQLDEANGSSFNADTYTRGKIDAVRFKSEGTLLVINGMEIPLNKVADITTGNGL